MSASPTGNWAVAVMSDLDRTLIYSQSAMMLTGTDRDTPRLLCVEVYGGRPLSFVTERAAGLLAQLAETGMLVPTTTRTVEQYQRINLPGPAPRYAICTNGGRLLVDGVEDGDFTAAVADRLTASAPHAEIFAELTRVSDAGEAPAFVEKVRDAAGLFCYAVVNRSMLPDGWLEDLIGFAHERAWGVSLQGRKVYLVPASLTKAAAAAEVAQRLGVSTMVAAGDSLLDSELLEVADRAIRPNHGELADAGWVRPHATVTRASGVAAGEEIVEWMLEQVQAAEVLARARC